MLRGPASIVLAGDRGELVGDLERTEALRARVEGSEPHLVAALATLERDGVAERALSRASSLGQLDRAVGHDSAHGFLLLICPGTSIASGRIWHRFHVRFPFGRVTAPGGGGSWRLPGLHRAVPSVPLDEQVTNYRERRLTGESRSHHSRRCVRDARRRLRPRCEGNRRFRPTLARHPGDRSARQLKGCTDHEPSTSYCCPGTRTSGRRRLPNTAPASTRSTPSSPRHSPIVATRSSAVPSSPTPGPPSRSSKLPTAV